jgi:hypothetical protein
MAVLATLFALKNRGKENIDEELARGRNNLD